MEIVLFVLWVICYGIYSRTEIMKTGETTLRKININTSIYVKTPKGKNHVEGEKDSTVIMTITMVIL